jgi:hypothetical protein
MTFEERIRACLGPIPAPAARQLLPRLVHADGIELAYEWIKDWDILEGLDFQDGSDHITFLRPTLSC